MAQDLLFLRDLAEVEPPRDRYKLYDDEDIYRHVPRPQWTGLDDEIWTPRNQESDPQLEKVKALIKKQSDDEVLATEATLTGEEDPANRGRHAFASLPSPFPPRPHIDPVVPRPSGPGTDPFSPSPYVKSAAFPQWRPPRPVVRLPSPFLPPSAMALASSREISPLPPSHTSHPAPPPPAAVPRSCRHPLSPLLPLQPASPSPATANTPSPPSPSTHKKGCKARPPYPLRCAHTRRLAPLLPSLAQRQDLPRSSREDTKTTPR